MLNNGEITPGMKVVTYKKGKSTDVSQGHVP